MNKVASKLKSHAYFGRNWNALEDCLRDLIWLPGDGYIIVFSDYETFSERAPDDFNEAIDVFQSAIDYWNRHGVPMFLILATDSQ